MSNDSIKITLASLVKNKKGLFVSEKQRDFILSQCQEVNTYITFTSARRPSTLFYYLDDKGVTLVEKRTYTGKLTTEYDRNIDPNVAIRKRLLREIKGFEESIKARELSKSIYIESDREYQATLQEKEAELLLQIAELEKNKQVFIDNLDEKDYDMFLELKLANLAEVRNAMEELESLYESSMKIDRDNIDSRWKMISELDD